MEKIQKPKRVERIPIKRGSYQKRIESVELSRDGSSRVVDLRSIAAKKEAQKRAEQQRLHDAEREREREQAAIALQRQVREEQKSRPPKQHVGRAFQQQVQQGVRVVAQLGKKIQPRGRVGAPITTLILMFRRFINRTMSPLRSVAETITHQLSQHMRSLSDVQKQTLRSMRNFAIILCLVIVPATGAAAFAQVQLKEDRLTQQAEEAFGYMLAAGKSIQAVEFEKSANEFLRAKQSLDAVGAELDGLNGVLVWFGQWIPGKGQQAYAAAQLIKAGGLLAGSGVQLSEEAATIQATQENSPDELLQTIAVSSKNLAPIATDIHTARTIIDAIEINDIPEDKREQLRQIQAVLPIFDDALQQGMGVTDAVLNLLGSDGERRYIILFQNNRELRPTGGFIGSLAIVTVRDGVIQAFEAPGGGVYDIAGQLQESVISPKPLHLVNASWNLQDANWFASFPDSAKKVQWFYERSNGATVDGVIAITPDILEKVMEIIGEVTVDDEGTAVTVNAENIYTVLQSRDDEDLLEGAKPKTLIGNLTPVILNRMIESAQDPKGAAQMLNLLATSLNEKDVLLTVNDAAVQAIFSQHGWTGEIAAAQTTADVTQDYIFVNHANIAGGKTDQVIEETIEHSADIAADGSITNTVKITRVHKGDVRNPLENVKNNSYTRVYVPEGSQLITATGFEVPPTKAFFTPDEDAQIDQDLQDISGESLLNEQLNISLNQEYGKTVIGGWMITDVGESSSVTLTYRLPFTITMGKWFRPTHRYELLVQKQPGMRDPYFVSRIQLPDSMTASAWYPDDVSTRDNHEVTVVLSDDSTRGVLLTTKK